jgi:hypothetical protein
MGSGRVAISAPVGLQVWRVEEGEHNIMNVLRAATYRHYFQELSS